MDPEKAVEILSDTAYNRSTTFNTDFYDALKMAIDALRLVAHRTTYCLDDHSLKLLRDAVRREHGNHE